jgi:phage baseplate assembly protein W
MATAIFPVIPIEQETAMLGPNWRLQFADADGIPMNMLSFESIDFGAISYKEIFQNVKTILATPIFSAALERTLGLDQSIVDRPIDEASQVTVAILDALQFWEPRCEVINIDFEADPLNGHLTAKLQLNIKNVIFGTNQTYEATNIFATPRKVEQEPPVFTPVAGPPGPPGPMGPEGPPGEPIIPEPLLVGELKAGSTVYIGQKLRVVGLANGGQLEVQDSSGDWIVQSRWTET